MAKGKKLVRYFIILQNLQSKEIPEDLKPMNKPVNLLREIQVERFVLIFESSKAMKFQSGNFEIFRCLERNFCV